MFYVQLATTLLTCVIIAGGQLIPPAVSSAVCTIGEVQAGNSYQPHETYCEEFYHCDLGQNLFTRSCAYGTLYNPNIFTCVRPEEAVCNNWPCDATNVGRRYPSQCCDVYYECQGSGFKKSTCPSGQIFEMTSGKCVTGNCEDKNNCIRLGVTDAPDYKCFDVPSKSSNPCTYDTVWGGITYSDRPCAYGTAFNETLCQCSIKTSVCPNGVNYLANKYKEKECRVSLSLDFNKMPLVATSPKLGGRNLDYYFQTSGVTVSGGSGLFINDPASSTPSFVYSYHLNANQLGTPFAMSVVLKWDTPNIGQQISLLSNTYYPNVCTPTFEGTATFNGNNIYKVDLKAVGVSSQTKLKVLGSTSALITLKTGYYLELLILFDGTLSGQLIDRGVDGLSTAVTNWVNFPATGWIGDYIAINKCGMLLGKGLNGAVERIREGCTDFSKVKVF